MKYKTVWDKRTIKAWQDSVAHWERLASGNRLEDESMFSEDCAFCALFIDDGCYGCPVAAATGEWACAGSPWKSVGIALGNEDYDTSRFKKAAKKELAFLKSLRPEKQKIKNKGNKK